MLRLLAALLFLAVPAQAQELRVAVEAGPTSNDPHYHSLIANIAFSRHVFEPLVAGGVAVHREMDEDAGALQSCSREEYGRANPANWRERA